MTNGEMFGLVCAAGAVGGVVHDLLTGTLTYPRNTQEGGGQRQWSAGTLGSIVLGVVAAGLSWALYGPLSGADIAGGRSGTATLTWGALGGAVLVGGAGTRWIRAEIEKRDFKSAAVAAAGAHADAGAAGRIAAASGKDALAIAQGMPVPAAVPPVAVPPVAELAGAPDD